VVQFPYQASLQFADYFAMSSIDTGLHQEALKPSVFTLQVIVLGSHSGYRSLALCELEIDA
jgi:hypothetical protein